MKTPKLLAILLMLSCFQVSAVNASEHHSGHGGSSGGGGGGENGCLKPQLTKFVPANMTTVAPESEFSFLAFNVEKPGQIKVSVKGIPVEISTEDKETFFVVKGKLPAELVNTTARINIKVTAKVSRCNGENGWLVKIAEK
ncbi:MAG: hypothetical protein Q8Q50_16500 [Methylobacter sp.]|nr:hypothetical protein [Methylobacter sp.]